MTGFFSDNEVFFLPRELGSVGFRAWREYDGAIHFLTLEHPRSLVAAEVLDDGADRFRWRDEGGVVHEATAITMGRYRAKAAEHNWPRFESVDAIKAALFDALAAVH